MDNGEIVDLNWIYGRDLTGGWLLETGDPHERVHIWWGRMPDPPGGYWVGHTGHVFEAGGRGRVFGAEDAALTWASRLRGILADTRAAGTWRDVPPPATPGD